MPITSRKQQMCSMERVNFKQVERIVVVCVVKSSFEAKNNSKSLAICLRGGGYNVIIGEVDKVGKKEINVARNY